MIEYFKNLVTAELAKDPEQEGDYLNDDGILCCGVCGEPKRRRLEVSGLEVIIVPKECRCSRERRAAQEAVERAEQNELHRTAAFDDVILRGITFADDDDPQSVASRAARGYASSFNVDRSNWMLIHGGCGTGKSFLACCIVNAVIDKGYTARFTSISAIERRLWNAADKSEIYEELKCPDLLVIDDLCAERQTDYTTDVTYNVIDTRLRCGRPAIITTNLTAAELMNPQTLPARRIFSRIFEKSVPLSVEGADRRRESMRRSASAELAKLIQAGSAIPPE